MKTLELELNKRLLIVELPENHTYNTYADKMTICNEVNNPIWVFDGKCNFVCNGCDLTEDIAKGLVLDHFHYEGGGEMYTNHKYWTGHQQCFHSAKPSFISAIEAAGYHWGENPEGDQPHNTGLLNLYPTGHVLMDVSLDEAKKWQESESRTFYPEKCIIFEIL